MKKENLMLKKKNEELILKLNNEIIFNKCSNDFQKKPLELEKSLGVNKEESLDITISKEIIEFYDFVYELNSKNKATYENLIEKFQNNILEIFPTASVIL